MSEELKNQLIYEIADELIQKFDMEISQEILTIINKHDVNKDYITEQVKDACKFCQNNPNNDGTGVCSCILGSPVIY